MTIVPSDSLSELASWMRIHEAPWRKVEKFGEVTRREREREAKKRNRRERDIKRVRFD